MTGLEEAIKIAGGIRALGRLLGITSSAIIRWRGVPPTGRILQIEAATGVPRERLRPDLYRKP